MNAASAPGRDAIFAELVQAAHQWQIGRPGRTCEERALPVEPPPRTHPQLLPPFVHSRGTLLRAGAATSAARPGARALVRRARRRTTAGPPAPLGHTAQPVPLRHVPPVQVRDLHRPRPVDAQRGLPVRGVRRGQGARARRTSPVPDHVRRLDGSQYKHDFCHHRQQHRAEPVCARRRLRHAGGRRLHRALSSLQGARLPGRRLLRHLCGPHALALRHDGHRPEFCNANALQLRRHPERAREVARARLRQRRFRHKYRSCRPRRRPTLAAAARPLPTRRTRRCRRRRPSTRHPFTRTPSSACRCRASADYGLDINDRRHRRRRDRGARQLRLCAGGSWTRSGARPRASRASPTRTRRRRPERLEHATTRRGQPAPAARAPRRPRGLPGAAQDRRGAVGAGLRPNALKGTDALIDGLGENNPILKDLLKGVKEELLRAEIEAVPDVTAINTGNAAAGAGEAPSVTASGTSSFASTTSAGTSSSNSYGYGRRLLQRVEYNTRMTDALITHELMRFYGKGGIPAITAGSCEVQFAIKPRQMHTLPRVCTPQRCSALLIDKFRRSARRPSRTRTRVAPTSATPSPSSARCPSRTSTRRAGATCCSTAARARSMTLASSSTPGYAAS